MFIDTVQSWMRFYGWDDGGKPGSVKRDVHGYVVARHKDPQWEKDLEEACQAARRELSDAETL